MYPKHIGNCTTQYMMIASVIVRDRHLPCGVICYELGVCPAQLEGRWISPPSWPVPPLQMEFGEGGVLNADGGGVGAGGGSCRDSGVGNNYEQQLGSRCSTLAPGPSSVTATAL